jgi:tetratricopeptide (TPR) repeat protein
MHIRCNDGRWIAGMLVAVWASVTIVLPAQEPSPFKHGQELFAQQKFREAADAFGEAILADPDNSEAWRQRARCRTRLDDLKGALTDYDKSIDIDPRNASAWSSRSMIKHRLKDREGALVDVEKAIAISPNYAGAYTNRGLLRADAGDTKGAIEDYDRAIALDPKQSAPFNNRGLAKEKLNNLEGALVDYTRAVEIDPKNADAFSSRAFVSNKLGDAVAARRDYGQALAINPTHKFATEQLKKLDASSSAPVTTGNASLSNAAAPTVEFPAGDPCHAATAPNGGMPWAKSTGDPAAIPAPPAGIPAATLAPFLDFNNMSTAQFNGAASVAMEGMRIAYGEMTPDQERRFQAAWAPMFDYPAPEEVAYLNNLNPLLGQFLAGREALMRASAAAQIAAFDSALGVAASSREGYFDALAMIDRQAAVVQSLQVALADIAQRIGLLGNPPSPFDEKCKARRRHAKSLQGLKNDEVDPGAPGLWTGEFVCTSCKPCDEAAIRQHYGELESKLGMKAGAIGDVIAAHRCGPQPFEMVWRPRDPSYTSDKFMLYAIGGTYYGVHDDNWSGLALEADEKDAIIRKITFPGGYNEPSDSGRLTLRLGTGSVPRGWTPSAAAAYISTAAAIETYRDTGGPSASQWLRLHNFDFDIDGYRKTAVTIDRFNQERSRFLQAGAAFLALPESQLNSQGGNFAVFQGQFNAIAPATDSKSARDSKAADEAKADREATIAFHRSMVLLLDRNLQLEQLDFQRETDPTRRNELAFRIIQLQSDMQAEQDLIESVQTRKIVHTRSAFDEFAHDKFVSQVRIEAARADATRRIAVGVERQIELLPWELKRSMRQKARQILDPATVASGNVEKARSLADSMNEMVTGYWQGEAAREDEKAINAQEYEFYATTIVMTAGSVVMGLGGSALADAFGADAAITLWGPNLIGGIYGGGTGLIAGGPVEGIRQSLTMAAPPMQAVFDFVDGYRLGNGNPTAGWEDRLWAGAERAGFSLALGAAINVGAKLTAAGAQRFFGKESVLFRPIGTPTPTIRQQFAAAKFKQDVDDATSLINRFREQRVSYVKAQSQYPAGSPQLLEAERELQRLSASLNSSYHCKWLLKYKADPSVRREFSRLVDDSYAKTMPEMTQRLHDMGYEVSNLKFRPMRNASSAGTSSMDLDLALDEPPGLVILKNGKPVEMSVFQQDASKAMNEAYHQVTGFSGNRSEINLTTSAHAESFSNKALLNKNVNFNDLRPEDVASIGKVLQVKFDKIKDDAALSEIAKMQARCRESAKEIDNMLLKKLRQKQEVAQPGSPEATEIDGQIEYWTEMLLNFRAAGATETNPYQILEMDRLMRGRTGGKGFQEVSTDLVRTFGTR